MATADLETNDNNQTGASGGQGKRAGAADKVRQSAQDAYEAARDRTTALYGSARDRASSAGRRAADGVDANPLAAVAGGLAIGALIAAILPRSQRETDAFGPLSEQIHSRARQAFKAGQDAGLGKFEELGFSRDAARQKLSDLAAGAGEAFRASAGAAFGAARGDNED